MKENNKVYKEGDIVKIRTNKCNVHLMEMFGHCKFHPDEISSDDYVALITAVIGNGVHYSVTIFTPYGECYHVIDNDEILEPSDVDELPEDKRELAQWKNPVEEISYTASGQAMPSGLSPDVKRLSLAVAAVNQLHPEGKIRVVELSPRQSFLRAAIYKGIDDALAQANLSSERQKELEERKKLFVRWANTLHFEEHYQYHVVIDKSNREPYEEPDDMAYFIVAVNEAANKAFVMGTGDDQDLFFDYMGPDFKELYMEANFFRDKCNK